ncbi:MAG TPA: alkaline phosphatase family protein [Alphaproteobacteria bacterium]|nr:alkaline phosphatase family protein [Alphaproteobacteria bacterium]
MMQRAEAGRVILLLIDGLGYETAVRHCGYLEGLVQAGAARRWRMRTALPSLSRPLYETVLTGLAPHDHGVTSNDVCRLSRVDHVFGVARRHGRRTGAAAYAWISELYNRAPFDPRRDIECDDEAKPIQHGRFYLHESYPDRDLLYQAAALIDRRRPDFMLIHPMGCDMIGHKFGSDSPEYRTQASKLDSLLAALIPDWRADGYDVLVTADHGMNADGYHGGTLDDVCRVAFYHIGHPEGGSVGQEVSQLSVAPTILTLMGLPIPDAMRAPALG